jgi:hypothetical protein
VAKKGLENKLIAIITNVYYHPMSSHMENAGNRLQALLAEMDAVSTSHMENADNQLRALLAEMDAVSTSHMENADNQLRALLDKMVAESRSPPDFSSMWDVKKTKSPLVTNEDIKGCLKNDATLRSIIKWERPDAPSTYVCKLCGVELSREAWMKIHVSQCYKSKCLERQSN